MRPSVPAALVLLVGLGGLLIACGNDDGADVRSSGDTTASGAAAGGSGSGTSSGSGPPGCTPVGSDLIDQAVETVDIDLLDYAFGPSEVSAPAGVVTFLATNQGSEDHELGLLPGGGPVPFGEPGVPDEEALAAAGAVELAGFPPGTSCDATWELAAGDYTLFCVLTAEDGETHYEKGMRGTLTVG